MSKKVNVHVGTMEDMGRRFVSAWRRLETGEKVRERHVTFEDLPALLNALTPKRLELLREVRREPAASVRVLASRLGRDYKRVHGDVEAHRAPAGRAGGARERDTQYDDCELQHGRFPSWEQRARHTDLNRTIAASPGRANRV